MKSWMEISSERLIANVHAVQDVAGNEVEVLAVVKANGYGHDAAIVAKVLMEAGVRWLGVSDLDEGIRVRQVGDARILVMCAIEPADAPALVAHQLTPIIWTLAHIEAIEHAAQSAGHPVAVHLEIDTGMARQGVVRGPELAHILARLTESRWIVCEGVMSHLAESEVAGSSVTTDQQRRFHAALQQVAASGVWPAFVHFGNTSAVDEHSTIAWTVAEAAALSAQPMVRTGLAVYGGCLPLARAPGPGALRAHLQPALTWKTRVVGLREIAAGATVGYGATFTAARPMRLALLPIGYADGFRREASSGIGDGWVMLAGQRAPVIGRVSMNLTTVDVTDLEVKIGEEVVLLGDGVSAEDHARWCGTIAYEIVCGIRARVQSV